MKIERIAIRLELTAERDFGKFIEQLTNLATVLARDFKGQAKITDFEVLPSAADSLKSQLRDPTPE